MTTVHLGFKAFDPHELACHFIARHAGLYAARGMEVRLLDTTFLTDGQLPPVTFHAACTAALYAWLRGAPMRVVFVACDRPMFWLVGRPGALDGGGEGSIRLAGYPPGAPPGELLRLVLAADRQTAGRHVEILPVRDDVARLGLVAGGDVDAAVISSGVAPGRLRRLGLDPLRFFGDAVRVPTTGLAVHRDLLEREPEVVRAMRDCHREALKLLHTDARLSGEALARFLDLPPDDAQEAVSVLRRYCTQDGCSTPAIEAAAIDALRDASPPEMRATGPLYAPSRDP